MYVHIEDAHHSTPCETCGAPWELQLDSSWLMRHSDDCAYITADSDPEETDLADGDSGFIDDADYLGSQLDELDDDQTAEDFSEIFKGGDR